MTIEIKVPALGESVTEATVARWMRQAGEAVAADEAICELETDKVTVEVNAPAAGTLAEIRVAEGSTVTIGQVLALLAEGDAGKAASRPAAKPATKATPVPDPATAVKAQPAGAPLSPAVRKLVVERRVDPAAVPASGKGGRITKGDVLALERAPAAAPAAAPARQPAPAAEPRAAIESRERRVRMTRLRRRIAERLKAAQNTAAILTTFNECDMGAILALRDRVKDSFEKKHGVRLGFMSFFVKAAVAALAEIPAVNAEIDGEDLVYKDHYDIGVAVGTEQGLVVPVLRDADRMSFAEIEKTIAALGRKAREGKLAIEDLSGGTFTISNGGVYGSLMSTPILNPPQSGILGMHKTQNRPIAVGERVEIRPMMYLALSYDHRVVDGREAVTFLIRVKEFIEDPQRLLLEV